MVNNCSKLSLLLWKDWKIALHHKCTFATQIIIPIVGACLLVLLRLWVPPQKHDITINQPFRPQEEFSQLSSHEDTTGRKSDFYIAWCGVGSSSFQSEAREVMEVFNGIAVKPVEYSSEDDLNNHLNSPDSMELKSTKTTVCGVILEDTSKSGQFCSRKLKITIRFPGELRMSKNEFWQTDLIYPELEIAEPISDNPYRSEGFIAVQVFLSLSILNHCSRNVTLSSIVDSALFARQYPYPKYTSDLAIFLIKIALNMVLMVSFLLPYSTTVKSITREKELQLKESMKIMGLSTHLHWSAWFLKSIMVFIAIIIVVVPIWKIKIGRFAVLEYTSWVIIFWLLVVWGVATICLGFMVSTWFSKGNVAEMAAALLWIIMFFPGIYIMRNYDKVGLPAKLTTSLLSNTALSLGTVLIIRAEETRIELNFSNICLPITDNDNLTLCHIFMILLLDSTIYLVIALYVENILPGLFGVPKPWYFFIQESHWNRIRTKPEEGEVIQTDLANFEEEPVGLEVGIQLRNLRKVFPKNKVAVQSVSLNMYEDQITVLLGHNGAGKSTLTSMLIGMYKPTRGTAIVYGHDLVESMHLARENMSMCLQHNILFDELTVTQHLYFFCKLKGLPKNMMKEEINKYINLLDLVTKENTQSRKLSGGMKRKLAVGISLCANSKVVLMDEPTSGVDTAARHSFWYVMRSEKQNRTMMLTTHAMDEADALGDRVAIMAEGKLICCGSPFFLKRRFGSGYKLIIEKGKNCDISGITDLLRDYIPNINNPEEVGQELYYQLNENQSPRFKEMLQALETESGELDVLSFGIAATTLEDVFMKTVEDQLYGELLDTRIIAERMSRSDMNPKAVTGRKLTERRLRAMCYKRRIILKRTWLLYILHALLPAVMLIILVEFLRLSRLTLQDQPPLTISLKSYEDSQTTVSVSNDAGNTTSPVSAAMPLWYEKYKTLINTRTESQLNDLGNENDPSEAFQNFILKKMDEDLKKTRCEFIVAATFDSEKATAWFNDFPLHALPLTLNLIINAILEDLSMSIVLINHPLPITDKTKITSMVEQESSPISSSISMAFGFVSAYFIIFPIKERICRSKHLQLVSGVPIITLWTMHLVWDFILFLLACILYIIVLAAYQIAAYKTFNDIARLFLLLTLLDWSILPFVYLVSLGFRIPSSGYIIVAIVFQLGGLFNSIIRMVDHINPSKFLKTVNTIFKFYPPYCINDALFEIQNNYLFSMLCESIHDRCLYLKEDPCCPGKCPPKGCLKFSDDFYRMEQPGVGQHVIFFIMDGILYWAILLLVIEYDWVSCKRRFTPGRPNEDDVDSDVLEEEKLILSYPIETLKEKYTLCLRDVTKIYGNFTAVNHICIGVEKGECFGLLGANGAGKTSTFKMMTGELKMDDGVGLIQGFDIRKDRAEVHQHIGYCPQFDALLDVMTGRETLRMFCMIRGILKPDIPALIDGIAYVLLFSPFLDKRVKTYSGGTKRKLSTAITLLGNPPLVFLDEPTTGMDPVARRSVWNVLKTIRAGGTSIVFTSHSMDECEALCTKIAIMVNGRFKCLGSLQHLKNKFAQGYVLQIKIRNIPKELSALDVRYSSIATMYNIKWFIESKFPGAILRDDYSNLLTYILPKSNLKFSDMFGIIEESKDDLYIEDYTLAQTNLEQVFLTFVKSQVPETTEYT